ncbi:hypothetical protein F5984_19560 [Rudanella paleaurantiibacter]|uniref:Lipocalin-like domain-containing protein n=1 Tax=Rudanella paleaurantiibacter TaxID=2614655 RepID=A0A7J5TX06_9BACT|nr:hypothetical protein [Rudanella paleaurantiibacter]KAB7727956.1 hypothetical protein F5984_19560 [Rudanella paleaurantiibacter]
MMIFRFALLLFLMSPDLMQAQSVVGTWQGTMTSPQNESVQVVSMLTLRQSGANYTGELVLQLSGARETYTVSAAMQNNLLAGTATYPTDQTAYQFEAMLQNGKLVVGVGLLNIPVMGGVFTKVAKTAATGSSAKPAGTTAGGGPDGLPRNSRLVGAWAHTRYYGSGEFYGSVRTTLFFYPDGRIGSGDSSGNASMGGSSVSSNSDGVQILEGVRWYTKGSDQIWIRNVGGGADRLYAEYGMATDGQKMLLYRNGGKQIYYRTQ